MNPDLACVKVVSQRHALDCVICCLSMLLGTSYEATLLAVSKVVPHAGTNGLFWTDARKAARALQYRLKVYRGQFDPDNSCGILAMMPAKKTGLHHAVVLMRGVVIDPADGSVWDDLDAYRMTNHYKIGSLLVIA